jgi:membrane protein implicated in regulation of membrane protease activity
MCLAWPDGGKQHGPVMLGIPRRYSHFVFGIIQSGLTSLIAAGIASFPAGSAMIFIGHWMVSWLIAWAAMLPIVLMAAPAIRAFALRLTREDSEPRAGSQA